MDGLVYKSRFIGPACFINVDGNIVRLVEPPSFVYKSRLIGPACFINVYGNIVRLVKPPSLVYKSRFILYVCILYNIIYLWCKHEITSFFTYIF